MIFYDICAKGSEESTTPEFRRFGPDGSSTPTTSQNFSKVYQENARALTDRKILILVHGFNNTDSSVADAMSIVQGKLQGSYSLVMGFRWPSCEGVTKYAEAKASALKVSRIFTQFLNSLKDYRVDIMAHSLGNLVTLSALNYYQPTEEHPLCINNFFSLAAAVEDCSLDRAQDYHRAALKATRVAVLYSKNDLVVNFGYPIGEIQSDLRNLFIDGGFERALGGQGSPNPKKLAKNVAQLDCSWHIFSHSGYKDNNPIMAKIAQMADDPAKFDLMKAHYGNDLILNSENEIEPKDSRSCCVIA